MLELNLQLVCTCIGNVIREVVGVAFNYYLCSLMMYIVEKRNISVVMDTEKHTGLLGADEKREIKEIQEKFKQDLRIPRRYRERERERERGFQH